MTSSAKPEAPNPHDEPLAEFGKGIILVPLIIGGAVVVAVIMLWHAHVQRVRLAEAAQTEILVRNELRSAYMELRRLRPDMALERAGHAANLMASLESKMPSDFAGLKVAQLLVEGESLFMENCRRNAAAAEVKFDEALAYMSYASGDMWQFGMLGRARARFEQEKYEEAVRDLDQIMDRNPSFGAAYYWRSLAHWKLGNDALAHADEVRARNLDSWPPLRDFMQANRAWTRDILGRQAGADEFTFDNDEPFQLDNVPPVVLEAE
ncbi:MAG: tetratricopeptide repeat protein [Planctomycetaceae bacterium]|nr:tetratricopeptide repeat protein [Planctomycetaceae bacterium]